MKELNVGKIIVSKRREKGVTQDQLAAYIGVSKSSVSKWETQQSYPDITFLPQIAAYFNISIDDLMGYSPQMTKEDIKKLYQRLSSDFATQPFDNVLAECLGIIKKFYSCFPLLFQMSLLLCNHYMLTKDTDLQKNILEKIAELCIRIKTQSGDVWLSKDAISLEATCYLIQQQPQSVLNLLGEIIRPASTDDAIMAQAYQIMGDIPNANKVLQVSMYQHLTSLVGFTHSFLHIHINDKEKFQEILHRILSIAKTFDLDRLHPNIMALTYLTGAQGYSMQCDTENALCMLQKYADICTRNFFPYTLHGDNFFDQLDSWFSESDSPTHAPRSEKLIKESMLQGVMYNPAFTVLEDHPGYKTIISRLKSNLGGNPYEERNK
ncbi:MAG: helix-turn-helix transcriptional regulator, partial [Clostridium sp.]